MNGVEYKYVQEWTIPKDLHSSVIRESSCQGSEIERFTKFRLSQDDTFHLFMLHIFHDNYLYIHFMFVLCLSPEQKPVVWVQTVSSPGLKLEPHVLLGDDDTGHVRFYRRQWFPWGYLDSEVL